MDALTHEGSPVRYGDIAVLAISTWNLRILFSELDARGVPYASQGGPLFLADPLRRQFLLGLRARGLRLRPPPRCVRPFRRDREGFFASALLDRRVRLVEAASRP